MIITLNPLAGKVEVEQICQQLKNLELEAATLPHRPDISLMIYGVIT